MSPDYRRLVKQAAVARRTGRLDEATLKARAALYLEPNDAAATRELVRALHLASQTLADLDEASELVRQRLDTPDPRPADMRLMVDHAIRRLQVGASYDTTIQVIRRLGVDFPDQSLQQIRRFSSFLIDSGESELAAELLEDLASASETIGHLTTLHGLRVRQQRFEDADAIADRVELLCDRDNAVSAWLRTDVLLARENTGEARLAIDQIKPAFDRPHSARLVAIWRADGRHDKIIDHIYATRSGYTPTERAYHLFDSHWALGDRQNALSALQSIDDADRQDPSYLTRVGQIHGPASAAQLRAAAIERALDTLEDDASVLRAVRLLSDANDPQAIVELTGTLANDIALGPSNRYTRARALYALRRFEESDEILAALRGTNHTWTAAKLRARILLESGRFEDAEINRRTGQRPGDGHDEALYHALLSQHRWTDAFAMDPIEDQFRALQVALPSLAERHPSGLVGHRFVIADAGPGDQIQDASVFNELAEMSDRLTVTCDPRVHSIFSRSMPGIEFVACHRIRSEDFGAYGPNAPARANGRLSQLLTAEALSIAQTADRVALGRSVKSVRDLAMGPRPVPAYLQASRESCDRFGEPLGRTGKPLVGIVWRSELRDMMRDIHYLRASDLNPLYELQARIVCLQHDIDDREQTVLSGLGRATSLEVEHIDLRNDLEGVAGLLSHLDLVVGIGTTTTNLAGALGIPTLMMQPTHFGSWLAHGPENNNFWYQSCEVVVVDPPYDRAQLVRRTAERAAAILGEQP